MTETKRKQRLKQVSTVERRRICFLNSIKKGRIYECVSCHRKCFETSILPLPLNFERDIDENYPPIYRESIGEIKTKRIDNRYYWCLTCKNYITKGKLPPLSNQNSLDVFDLTKYEELKLSELENCLIARNILFQKVYLMPKSRWPAIKDRTINIPIMESDVINTVKMLPRTPSEAGLIPVSLKRKLSYKQSHKRQYVSVPKVLQSLDTLKKLGNKHYQFVSNIDGFKERYEAKDIDDYNLVFTNDEKIAKNVSGNDQYSQPDLTDSEDEVD